MLFGWPTKYTCVLLSLWGILRFTLNKVLFKLSQKPSQFCPQPQSVLRQPWGMYLILCLNIWVESLGYWPLWVMKWFLVCNEPHHGSTQMNNFISTFSRKRICWLLLSQTKHKQTPNGVTYHPQLKDSDLQTSPLHCSGCQRNPLPCLSWMRFYFWHELSLLIIVKQ